MNYIEQIKGFWRVQEIEVFPPNAAILYLYLLEINNKVLWKTSFKRNNSKICADLGISKPTLNNSRNRLKQAGLIDFETKNGNPNVTYTIKSFLQVTNEVSNEVANEVSNKVVLRLDDTKDKLKHKRKPKHNKGEENSPPLTPEPELILDFKNICNEVIEYFNKKCTRLPKVRQVSKTRKSKIQSRINDFGKEKVLEVINLTADSNFLNGENKRNWNATFDWILEPANFIKVLEGNFKNKETKNETTEEDFSINR